jgi:hypothetical protein
MAALGLWSTLSLALGAAAPPPPAPADATEGPPPVVVQAVTEALAVPGARALIRAYQPAGACPAAEARLERPIEGSGRFAVRLRGPSCQGWAWVKVEVRAPVSVTTRTVDRGEPLDQAVAVEEREVRTSRAPARVAAGARASRRLARGQIVEASHVVAPGAAVGAAVKVIVKVGAIEVGQSGRIVSCAGGRTCAVLPSGKHVTGDLIDGALVVDGP